ncbi:MAG: YeeE/YedE thiosulfate transporter family protein [Flavobacteriaceae bacterium]
MMTLTLLFLGFLFGGLLQYAKLNKYNVVSGLALRNDFTVAKAIAIAIGVGALVLNTEIAMGLASYHVKPFIAGGLVFGGLIFGAGMAILGYCPGTLAVSLGEGSLDALIGIVGGLLGGVVYTLLLPTISPILGPDLGNISLRSLTENNTLFFIFMLLLSLLFILAAFGLQKKDPNKSKRWIVSGMGLGLLNTIVFSSFVADRPIGASTTYPYAGDVLANMTQNEYFTKIETSGHWELMFLLGAFVSGVVWSLVRKDFRFTLLHENWKKHKGNSALQRVVWAFIGGFLLIMGARMAGGCTSGHILSGGMQWALSSLTFALFTFVGLLVTGKFFYSKKG